MNNAVVKRPSKFACLLGLILLLGVVVVIRSPKPAAKTIPVPVLAQPSRGPFPTQVVPNDKAQPEATAAAPALEKPDEEIPLVESSWVKELRELRELAAQDADAALARVARMSDQHDRKSAAQSVCLIISDQDAAKAMLAAWSNDLGKFTDDSAENIAVEKLARQWAETDLVKAFVWASALPPDDEARRDRVVKGIASALAQVAPAEAAAMVAKHIHPDSAVHIDAAIEVLRTWAAQEYSGAMAWASLFPAGALRERSIEELANVEPAPLAPRTKQN